MAGHQSLGALAFLLLFAYGIGAVVRFNILHAEPLVANNQGNKIFSRLNDGSYLILGISYFISIAFYVRILSAFSLKMINIENNFTADLLTTAILLGIGLNGYLKGFDWLERLTEYSVNIKIAIIITFLLSLFFYDWFVLDFHYLSPNYRVDLSWTTVRQLFGMILIVQGFEISRYIGHKYPADLRVKTMRLAQIISSLIYLIFIYLIMFLMSGQERPTEIEIINLSQKVSLLLPYAITIGAIFSQFSAAVADTVGCGSTLAEYLRGRFSLNFSYLMITLVAIVLVWVYNVFEIISFASRTFAGYYLAQCLQALYVNHTQNIKGLWWTVSIIFLAIITALIIIFGIPASA